MKKIEIKEKLNIVYNFVNNYIIENGYSPSVREIAKNVGIKSTATVYEYLEKLKSSGLLNKSPMKKRAITLSNNAKGQYINIPLVGTVRAGQPLYAVENLDSYIAIPKIFSENENSFCLRVEGDSMINAGICDKDIIVVEKCESAINGDIVVALVDDCATVKRFYIKNNKIILHPENDSMSDMIFDDVLILGKVKGLLRKF